MVLVGGCGQSKHSHVASTTTRPTTSTTRRRPKATHPAALVCPLTGAPSPSGKIPHRAALAIKVENFPQARPQWGLDYADIVFEEPVEGGITRFIAVYQCRNAPRVEPVRSARLVDPDILEPLGRVLFAYSGAIQPVIDKIDSSSSLLEDVGQNVVQSAYSEDPTRVVPHELETSTGALYSAAAKLHYSDTPPPQLFTYGPPAGGGTPASAIHIHFPIDVTSWTWDPKTRHYRRSYSDTGPALQGDGAQITAVNVVVLHVTVYPTPYVEDSSGTHEDQLVLTGSGQAWVFRSGAQFYGKWVRPSLADPTTFVETNGTRITLAPGNTWEELVPTYSQVSVTP
jgi:hypothetical protein